MDFKTALEFIVVRSNAMRPEFTIGGLMAAIRAPVAPIIKRTNALSLNSSVTIAAYNSDTQNVVSGDEASVRKLVDDLSIRSIKGTILSVNQGMFLKKIIAVDKTNVLMLSQDSIAIV